MTIKMKEKSFTLQELADLTDSQVSGDPNFRIFGVADLESAGIKEASFYAKGAYEQNSRYGKAMKQSQAGVIFVEEVPADLEERNLLISKNPSRSFQTVLEAFIDPRHYESGFADIHPSAVIHESVELGENLRIGPHVTIDQHCVIGSGTVIEAGVCIGPGVSIGENCRIYQNAVIRERCILGNRVILQPGSVIGSCGFGYSTEPGKGHSKLRQVGNVVLADDVEIGANTTIDRARFKSTYIGRGTKIDNLVQVGHGVTIGEDNLLVSQAGLAGSTETGNWVVIGGQVGIGGHLKIASGVIIGGQSGVSKSITKPGQYQGRPLLPMKEFHRILVHYRGLEHYVNAIDEIKRRLKDIEVSTGK